MDAVYKYLSHAQQLYTRRKLDEALNVAQKAQELSLKSSSVEDLIKAKLIIGKIHRTRSRFSGQPALLDDAIQIITEAQAITLSVPNPLLEIDIALAFGHIFLVQKKYDKAETKFKKATEISTQQSNLSKQIIALCGLSQLHIQQNHFNKALEYANASLPMLDQINDLSKNRLIAEVYNQLGQIYIKRQEYAKIPDYSQTVLEISREIDDVEKELTSLNNLAIVYAARNEYKPAMQNILEVLEKSTAINYRPNIPQCLINIGTIYANLYNYEDALEKYKTALEEYSDVIKANTKVITYNNVGNIYFTTKRYELAQNNFEQAHQLAIQRNYKELIALTLAQISRTKTAQKKYTEALEDANKVQKIIGNAEGFYGSQINLINLGNIYFQLGDAEKATNYIQEGIKASIALKDDTSKIDAFRLLAMIYSKQQNFEKAFQYQLQYSEAQEAFDKEQRNRQIIDLEIKQAIKEQQKEIEQLTKENELQAKLLEQSDQLAAQYEELMQVTDELRQFAYVASHDLKEPLRMIGSYTQLIKRRYKDRIEEADKSFFDFISEGVARMNSLLDALLKYATIGKTEEDAEIIKLIDAVDLCKINLKVLIEENNAEISFGPLPRIKAPYTLIIQLFQNLISNAIKFKKKDQKPIIRIDATKTEEGYVINVKDNGIGIESDYLNRIFIIFQRLHNRTEYEGTGIGLAICQKIAKRLGGRIWVESEFGNGSNFLIFLPKHIVIEDTLA